MLQGYYEKIRDDDKSIVLQRSKNHTYAAHFHTHLEIFLLRRGEYSLFLDGKNQVMHDGDIAVIDSFAIHGYQQLSQASDDCVIIIPFDRLHGFWQSRRGQRITNPILHAPELCDELLGLTDKYLLNTSSPTRDAGIQLMLARLSENLHFSPSRGNDEHLLVREILSFIQEHFKKPLTRSDIARSLGICEAHISRAFHGYLGKGFSQYINELRLQFIDKQRKNGDPRPLTELIFEAGFGSQQTYYRAKMLREGEKK